MPPAQAVTLALGARGLSVPLDPALEWRVLEARPIPESLGVAAAALDEWIAVELAGVWQRATAPSRVCIVIPDRTRRAPVDQVLHAVAAGLAKRGVSPGALDVVAATGTHREGAPGSWCAERAAASGLAVRAHDAAAAHRYAGMTPRGTRVAIDPLYLDADLRIVLSAPGFHYFAGFGGGPKMIFPGLADLAGTLANHRRALGPLPPGGLEPAIAPGRVDGNPVAEDIRDAARLAAAHWTIHALPVDGGWRFLSQESGERAARDALLAAGTAGEAGRYDVVVASAGGAPRDIDILQSHKALRHAAAYARDGGSVVLLAETPGGVGSEPLARWLAVANREDLERSARQRYDGNAQTAISLRAIADRVGVYWVGSNCHEAVDQAGAHAYADAAAACRDAISSACASGSATRGVVLPSATAIIPAESAAQGPDRRDA